MADQPFDRKVMNPLEKVLSGDLNHLQSCLDRGLRDYLLEFYSQRTNIADGTRMPRSGFVADSFRVVPSSPTSMVVHVSPGIGFVYNPSDVPTGINGITGLDDSSPYKPLPLQTSQSITVDPAPGPGQSRVDIIEVAVDRRVGGVESRFFLDEDSGVYSPDNANKVFTFDLDGETGRQVCSTASCTSTNSITGIGYKVGVATAGTPVVPTATPGYIKIAEILVGGTVTTLDANVIKDTRPLLFPHNSINVSGAFSLANNTAPSGQTLLGVVAPPGVLVACTIPTGAPTGEFRIDVFCGQLGAGTVVTAGFQIDDTTTATGPVSVPTVAGVNANANATLQDQTNYAASTPTVKIAVGQALVAVTGFVHSIANGGTISAATAPTAGYFFINISPGA